MSRNQSRAMGSTWTLAALRPTAAGLVFNECSGWGGSRGCGGTGSLGVGELLVCERPVDGFSWSPPGGALQADTIAEARGGRGCAPQERVTRPAASWADRASALCTCLVANSDQQTGRWRRARPAFVGREESRSTDDEERLLTKRSIQGHTANNCETLFEGEKAEKI